MIARALIAMTALVTLAGCASVGVSPRPTEVRLTDRALVVGLSDGGRCFMARPTDEAAWFGQLQGCALDWPYRVSLDPDSNVLRDILVAVFTRADGSVPLDAIGTVEITNPRTGHVMVFVSPRPTDED